jgi:hypothetical protein
VPWEVAGILRLRDPDLLASARLWKYVIEHLHAGIRVLWEEARERCNGKRKQDALWDHRIGFHVQLSSAESTAQ